MEDKEIKRKLSILQGKCECMISLACNQNEGYETLKQCLDDHIKAIFSDIYATPELLEV